MKRKSQGVEGRLNSVLPGSGLAKLTSQVGIVTGKALTMKNDPKIIEQSLPPPRHTMPISQMNDGINNLLDEINKEKKPKIKPTGKMLKRATTVSASLFNRGISQEKNRKIEEA